MQPLINIQTIPLKYEMSITLPYPEEFQGFSASDRAYAR